MDIEAYHKNYELEETNWWFVSRRTIILKIAKQYLKQRRAKIFDFGCGTGANLKHLSKFGNAVGGDVSKTAIKYCKKNGVKAILLKGKKLPIKKNSFDFITALDVLEHIAHDQETLNELYRVLKKQGIAVFTIPAFRFLWGTHDELLGHYRRYKCDEFRKKAEKAGFRVIKCSYVFAPFIIPLYVLRQIEKLKRKRELSLTLSKFDPTLDKLLRAYMRFEFFLLDYVNMPFGTSVLCICTKE